jgi:epoxyqueuosine reductase
MTLENDIERKARELGIDKIGIIRAQAMEGYAQRLLERMEKVPNGANIFGRFMGFSDITKSFPWAKSIVVAVYDRAKYRLPEVGRKHYGKHYLTDSRGNPRAPEYQITKQMGAFLESKGLKTGWNEHPGVTAMRWAAMSAGLGMIRRNNFFYTSESGSFVSLTAWAIDRELELLVNENQNPCPKNCDKCLKACPTKSLSAPYTMDLSTCVSRLTSLNEPVTFQPETLQRIGSWVYGCDACQDACPNNQGKWAGERDFPDLDSLSVYMSPESILKMSYNEIDTILRPKFFYIKSENLWRWKLNAMNVLLNTKLNESLQIFHSLLSDDFDIVKNFADYAIKNC